MIIPDRPKTFTDPNALAEQIEKMAEGHKQILVALAGPPGCGKSTLAAELTDRIQLPNCIIPMDGFHLDNETLSKRGILSRKGAPETFDLQGFSQLVEMLQNGTADRFPLFDRDQDCVIEDGGVVPKGTRILIIEGNYLLFDESGWKELANQWDASIWIEVPEEVLEKRLIRRWIEQGLSVRDARVRAQGNDMANMRRIVDHVIPPTWVLGPNLDR